MRVLIAGASGQLGSALVPELRRHGHEVRTLVRRETRADEEFSWDPPAGRIDAGAFDGVDAVLNLCGAPLVKAARWSAARKQLLYDSRIEPTEVLADAVREHAVPVLVNASGVNIYGDRGATEVTESAPAGDGFLAGLCAAWEHATAAADDSARVVRLRTAPVLAKGAGLLRILGPLFSVGLGGKLGNGRQFFPWIAEPDAVAALRFVLEHDDVSGPVNITGPNPVTNAEFTRALGRALRRPAPWRAPAAALRLGLGEVADELMLTSLRAVPTTLLAAGFTFTRPDLDDALASLR